MPKFVAAEEARRRCGWRVRDAVDVDAAERFFWTDGEFEIGDGLAHDLGIGVLGGGCLGRRAASSPATLASLWSASAAPLFPSTALAEGGGLFAGDQGLYFRFRLVFVSSSPKFL